MQIRTTARFMWSNWSKMANDRSKGTASIIIKWCIVTGWYPIRDKIDLCIMFAGTVAGGQRRCRRWRCQCLTLLWACWFEFIATIIITGAVSVIKCIIGHWRCQRFIFIGFFFVKIFNRSIIIMIDKENIIYAWEEEKNNKSNEFRHKRKTRRNNLVECSFCSWLAYILHKIVHTTIIWHNWTLKTLPVYGMKTFTMQIEFVL